MTVRTALLTVVCVLAPLAAPAQDADRPNLNIGRVSDARPVIDGVVDDEVWKDVIDLQNTADTALFGRAN